VPRRRALLDLVLAAGVLGLVAGLIWVDRELGCEAIADDPGALERRDASLASYLEDRCEQSGGCEQVEVVSTRACKAKVRVRAVRVDEYGEVLGTFETVDGLGYEPLLDRWRVLETLEDRQVLGLPVY
jgi:hypothetical protein